MPFCACPDYPFKTKVRFQLEVFLTFTRYDTFITNRIVRSAPYTPDFPTGKVNYPGEFWIQFSGLINNHFVRCIFWHKPHPFHYPNYVNIWGDIYQVIIRKRDLEIPFCKDILAMNFEILGPLPLNSINLKATAAAV